MRRLLLPAAAIAVLLVCAACGTSGTPDPCRGVECSGHGACALEDGAPVCRCDDGFHAEVLSCVADQPVDLCEGIACSDRGSCLVQDGFPICVCELGYHAEGFACMANDADEPCSGVTCSGRGSCSEVEGQAVCNCDTGYYPFGLACLEDTNPDPCAGVTCSGHGSCEIEGDSAACVCEDGFFPDGLACVAEPPDPCADVTCSDHGSCQVGDGKATCACDAGYHPLGLACVPDDSSADRPVWIVHVTDCHFGESDAAPVLTAILVDEILPVIAPVATVNTGDETERGAPEHWESYRAALGSEPPAYPGYFEIPGNHDVKDDHAPLFAQYAQTGLAGAGMYGETRLTTSAGLVRFVRANTADSSTDALTLTGIFGSEQAAELLALPTAEDVAYSVVAAHHPMTGALQMHLGANDMQRVIDHFGAVAYLCGHVHIAVVSWLGNTLHVQGSSLGKSDDPSFALVSLDSTGPSMKFVPLTTSPTWPLVLVTQPPNAALGGGNPYAAPFMPGQTGVLVRAIAFAPAGIEAVEVSLGGAAAVPLTDAGGGVWQAHVTMPAAPGDVALVVRATSAEGVAGDQITIRIGN